MTVKIPVHCSETDLPNLRGLGRFFSNDTYLWTVRLLWGKYVAAMDPNTFASVNYANVHVNVCGELCTGIYCYR